MATHGSASSLDDTRSSNLPEPDPYAPPPPLPPLGVEPLACDIVRPPPPGFVTRQDLCHIAGMDEGHLRRLTAYGLMPPPAKYDNNNRALYAESMAYEFKLNPPQIPLTAQARRAAFNKHRRETAVRDRIKTKRRKKRVSKEEVIALALKTKRDQHIGNVRTAAIFKMIKEGVPLAQIVIDQVVVPKHLKVVLHEYDQFTEELHLFGDVVRRLRHMFGPEVKDGPSLLKALDELTAKTKCPGVGCQRLRGLCTACARRSFRTAKDDDEDEGEDG